MRQVFAFSVALVLGAALGVSCGATRSVCSASSCNGCCDQAGVCQPGSTITACGKNGSSCISCLAGNICTLGLCTASNGGVGGGFVGSTGGGGIVTGTGGGTQGNTGGGISATGGGQATGGGSSGTGGGASGSCSGCQGCCSNGTCVTASQSQCGANGNACVACQANELCSAGACAKCPGCFDLATHTCVAGTSPSACGKGGAFCASCSTGCSNQACVSTCNAANCPTGCCNGDTCVPKSSYTDAQCGTGTAGAACTSCTAGGLSCDRDAGTCSSSAGLDAGFITCNATTPCPLGSCCLTTFSICVESGGGTGGIFLCGADGKACNVCLAACNPVTNMCP